MISLCFSQKLCRKCKCSIGSTACRDSWVSKRVLLPCVLWRVVSVMLCCILSSLVLWVAETWYSKSIIKYWSSLHLLGLMPRNAAPFQLGEFKRLGWSLCFWHFRCQTHPLLGNSSSPLCISSRDEQKMWLKCFCLKWLLNLVWEFVLLSMLLINIHDKNKDMGSQSYKHGLHMLYESVHIILKNTVFPLWKQAPLYFFLYYYF